MREESRRALSAVGMDLDKTLGRFLGNEALMIKLLGKFTDDTSFAQLESACQAEQWEDAFRAAHTLKGLAGNLGLDGLAGAVSEMVEPLRTGGAPPEGTLAKTREQYLAALEVIRSLN